MAEGGGDAPTRGTARRGRRQTASEITLEGGIDPDAAVESLEEHLDDAGSHSPQEPVYLYPGDVVTAKVVHTVQFDDVDSWFTYGVATRVQPEETEIETFMRVSEVVNTRSLDLAGDAEDHINSLRERVEREARQRREQRRIVPRSDQ